MSGDEGLRADRDILRNELRHASSEVDRAARRYRRVSSLLLLAAMLFGLMASGLAGEAARGGPIAAKVAETTTGKVPSTLPPGWRNVCGVIAIFTFIGTAASGINSILKTSEHKASAFACLGALDALRTELLREADLRRATLDRVTAELAKLRREHAEYFRRSRET
jgi:hypothetical protein